MGRTVWRSEINGQPCKFPTIAGASPPSPRLDNTENRSDAAPRLLTRGDRRRSPAGGKADERQGVEPPSLVRPLTGWAWPRDPVDGDNDVCCQRLQRVVHAAQAQRGHPPEPYRHVRDGARGVPGRPARSCRCRTLRPSHHRRDRAGDDRRRLHRPPLVGRQSGTRPVSWRGCLRGMAQRRGSGSCGRRADHARAVACRADLQDIGRDGRRAAALSPGTWPGEPLRLYRARQEGLRGHDAGADRRGHRRLWRWRRQGGGAGLRRAGDPCRRTAI